MLIIKIFKVILGAILIFFGCTVILAVSGYYQGELQKKMILTQEAIDNFEKDVEEGKEIDVNNYLEIKEKNYDNKFSNGGRYISNKINSIISNGIKKTLKIISKAIEE